MGARAFLRLLRLTDVSNFFLHYVKLVILIGVSTVALTSQGKDLKIFVLVAFAISAEIFAFVVNDFFDAELDALDPETRNPLAKGEISKRTTVIIGSIFLTISVFLLFFLPLRSIFLGIAGFLLALTYSWGVRAKLKPILDLIYHGALNTLPFIMGYTLYRTFDETCLLISFSIFIVGAVPEIIQEIRDYDFDRFFGKTTVVMLGKRRALTLSLGFMLVWFLVTAKVLDRLLHFPITLWGLRVPFQFLVLPTIALFILTPFIKGILSEEYQKDVFKRLRKRGLVVLLIVVSLSVAIFGYSSTTFFYGDPNYENYIVRLNVRTFIAGIESWNVALIKFRYIDKANYYYLLLHKNGLLELTKIVASERTYLAFIKTDLSPFDWHSFEITLEGPSIKVAVDGTLYFDVIDESLSKGIVCLSSLFSSVLALFMRVEVYSF